MSFSIEIVRDDGSFLSLAEAERLHIIKAITVANLSMTKATKLLGIGRSTLYRRIEDLNLSSHVEKLRSEVTQQKREEYENIRIALQLTSDVHDLCEMLKIDEVTLRAKMRYHGLSFLTENKRRQIARLKSETSKLAETGRLLIAA
jgi:DNA-binding NtrC family response regulator